MVQALMKFFIVKCNLFCLDPLLQAPCHGLSLGQRVVRNGQISEFFELILQFLELSHIPPPRRIRLNHRLLTLVNGRQHHRRSQTKVQSCTTDPYSSRASTSCVMNQDLTELRTGRDGYAGSGARSACGPPRRKRTRSQVRRDLSRVSAHHTALVWKS
jgi:hypothetical protein